MAEIIQSHFWACWWLSVVAVYFAAFVLIAIGKMIERLISGTSRAEADGLRAQVELYRLGNARYEFVRTLLPRQFRELWNTSVRGNGHFDYLVDSARADRTPAGKG